MDKETRQINKVYVAATLLALGLGIWARVNGLWNQVLQDDEWHAVHQIINNTPREFMLSFGRSDHSIPLTGLYWLISQITKLNEFLMRLPMLAAGTIMLVVWYVHVRNIWNNRVAILALWLLALSPVLIQYSRIARPYMLTLALLFASYWFFEQCIIKQNKYLSIRYIVYSITTSIAVWLHLTMLPFVVAPYVYHFFSAVPFNTVQREKLLKIIVLGFPTGLLTCLLILPPMINDFAALEGKSGIDRVGVDTIITAGYQIYGSSNFWLVIISMILSMIGLMNTLKSDWYTRYTMVGATLMTILLYISAPRWVHHAQTWLRYMLPILPVLIISISVGLNTIISKLYVDKSKRVFYSAMLLYAAVWFSISPTTYFLKPHGGHHILHPGHIFLYRPIATRLEEYFQEYHLSNFWYSLPDYDDINTVAVGPYYIESFNWPVHLWQNASSKNVIPMTLGGLCMDKRRGEAYAGTGIELRNRVIPDDMQSLNKHNVSLLVLNKPQWIEFESSIKKLGDRIEDCIQYMNSQFGPAWYEDQYLIAYRR